MSDFYEDLAHESGRPGMQPEREDIVTEADFAQMLQDRTRLTENDIVNRAAYRRIREKELQDQAAVNHAATRYPHAEELCTHLLMEREKHPQTIMSKRAMKAFYLVNPETKTSFDERQPKETIGEYSRRLMTQFEQNLIAQQQADTREIRRRYLWNGLALLCVAACIAGLIWLWP